MFDSATGFDQLDTTTIADALAAVAGWHDLTERQRAPMITALRLAARLSNLPPGAVPLSPAALRRCVLTRSPAALGIRLGTLRNMRSGLRAVCRRLGVIDATKGATSAAWQALLGGIDGKQRYAFVAFARFATAHAIAPEQVNDAVLAAFEAYLTERTLEPLPRKLTGRVLGAWNRAARQCPGWPATQLKNRRAGVPTLPLQAFPKSFQRELAAFGRRMHTDDLLDPFAVQDLDCEDPDCELEQPRRVVRPITAALRMSHIRWAASDLVATGVPAGSITSLACLVTPVSRVQAVLRACHEQAGNKATARGQHIAEALLMLARHHARLPAQDLQRIRQWLKHVTVPYHGLTAKNNAMLQGAFEPRAAAALLALPDVLMARARTRLREDPVAAASMALRALAVAFLTVLPLRLGNLRQLRFDRHLRRADPRGRITYLEIPAEEMKGNRPVLFPVAPHLAELLDEWRTRFAPHFSSAASPYLFPGKAGPAITPQGLRDAIKAAAAECVGFAVSPHQFRHIGATRMLQADPGHYSEPQKLLGHASPITTERSYAGLSTEQAARRMDALVAGERAQPGLRRSRPLPKRRAR